jgi:hypothetical protein
VPRKMPFEAFGRLALSKSTLAPRALGVAAAAHSHRDRSDQAEAIARSLFAVVATTVVFGLRAGTGGAGAEGSSRGLKLAEALMTVPREQDRRGTSERGPLPRF